MTEIPAAFMDLLQQKKAFANLATVMKDGSPQVTPVWFDYTNGHVRVNTAKGRVKSRTLREGAHVAMAILDPDNPYRYLQIRGQVVQRDRGRRRGAYRLAGEEVSRQGQVSVFAAGRCADHVRDRADGGAGHGLRAGNIPLRGGSSRRSALSAPSPTLGPLRGPSPQGEGGCLALPGTRSTLSSKALV